MVNLLLVQELAQCNQVFEFIVSLALARFTMVALDCFLIEKMEVFLAHA